MHQVWSSIRFVISVISHVQAVGLSCCHSVTPDVISVSSPLTVNPLLHAGPLRHEPLTIGKNCLHACPEMARNDRSEVVDCCAHDMWGAGYLMHSFLTGMSPWWFPPTDFWEDCQRLCTLHEDWVSPCCPFLSSLSSIKPVACVTGIIFLGNAGVHVCWHRYNPHVIKSGAVLLLQRHQLMFNPASDGAGKDLQCCRPSRQCRSPNAGLPAKGCAKQGLC